MKQKIFISILIVSISSIFAQGSFQKDKTQINFGLGLSGWGFPFYAGLDYSIHEDITIGGELSFRRYRESWNSDYYNHNILGLSVNGNYHFNSMLELPKEYDLYAGLNLGCYYWSSPSSYDGSHSSGVGIGAQIGGRYHISKKASINLEFGGGNAFSVGKIGLTIKLQFNPKALINLTLSKFQDFDKVKINN